MRLAKKQGISTHRVADLLFYGAISGLSGARVGYFLTHPHELASPLTFVHPRVGGASMYGAAVAIFPVFWGLCRRYHLDPKNMADLFAPGMALGLSIHRLGCLGTGCCYGTPCDWPWAVSLHGQALHPTQLYEAIPLFLIGIGLLWWWPKRQYIGQVTWLFALCYAPIRLVGEVFRGSPDRGYLIEDTLSVAQGVTLLCLFIAWAWIRRNKATH